MRYLSKMLHELQGKADIYFFIFGTHGAFSLSHICVFGVGRVEGGFIRASASNALRAFKIVS